MKTFGKLIVLSLLAMAIVMGIPFLGMLLRLILPLFGGAAMFLWPVILISVFIGYCYGKKH